MASPTITHEELMNLLEYDQVTGVFYWRVNLCRSRDLIGKPAGTMGKTYIEIRIHTRNYLAHRLAYFYMRGFWPVTQIGHINDDPKDNSWSNLREATASQTRANVGPLVTNQCGLKGVRFDPGRSKWRAQIWHDGKTIHLGMHLSKEAAYEAYCIKAVELHGEFARI